MDPFHTIGIGRDRFHTIKMKRPPLLGEPFRAGVLFSETHHVLDGEFILGNSGPASPDSNEYHLLRLPRVPSESVRELRLFPLRRHRRESLWKHEGDVQLGITHDFGTSGWLCINREQHANQNPGKRSEGGHAILPVHAHRGLYAICASFLASGYHAGFFRTAAMMRFSTSSSVKYGEVSAGRSGRGTSSMR